MNKKERVELCKLMVRLNDNFILFSKKFIKISSQGKPTHTSVRMHEEVAEFLSSNLVIIDTILNHIKLMGFSTLREGED